MSLIENPCELCRFYAGKLREINDLMHQYGDISGFGKWEFYLGKILEDSLKDDEAEAIKDMLCRDCPSLSIYGREYIRELKENIFEADEVIQTLDDKLKPDAIRKLVPILDDIAHGHEIFFDLAYKDVASDIKTGLKPD